MVRQAKTTELQSIADNDSHIATGIREEKQVGTNCEGFRMSFYVGDTPVSYFMKKSFLKGGFEELEEEYQLLKTTLKNLVPNTVFIRGKDGTIFTFSVPVVIACDLLDEKNTAFLKEICEHNPKILKKIVFFIRKFRELQSQGKILDLYGKENLIYTSDGDIKYIDNFVVFAKNKMVAEESIKKIEYLERFLVTHNFISV